MAGISPALWGLPVVKTTTERDARFPDPSLNQRVHNLQTGALERWNGSSWVTDFLNTGASTGTPALLVNGEQVLALPQAIDILGPGVSGEADGPTAKVSIVTPAAKNGAGVVVVQAPTGFKFQGTGVSVTADGAEAVLTITAGGGVGIAKDGAPVVPVAGAIDFQGDNLEVADEGGLVASVKLVGVSEGVIPMGGPGDEGLVDASLRASDLYGLLVGGILPTAPMCEARIETLSALNDGDPVPATWGGFTTVNAPTYKTADADGLPYVQFDGVDDYLNITTPASYTGKEILMLLVLSPTWPASGNTSPISVSVNGENQSQSGSRPILQLASSGAKFNLSRDGSGFPAQSPNSGSGDASMEYVVVAVHITNLTTQSGSTFVRTSIRTPAFPFWSLPNGTNNSVFDRVRLGGAYNNFGNPGDYAKMRLRYAGVWTGTVFTRKQVWSAIRYLQSTYLAD